MPEHRRFLRTGTAGCTVWTSFTVLCGWKIKKAGQTGLIINRGGNSVGWKGIVRVLYSCTSLLGRRSAAAADERCANAPAPRITVAFKTIAINHTSKSLSSTFSIIQHCFLFFKQFLSLNPYFTDLSHYNCLYPRI